MGEIYFLDINLIALSWNCINCEAANDYHHNRCEVCGYERYFSVSEVNMLLQKKDEDPSELKKLKTTYKRNNTITKKLREENREIQSQVTDLQKFKDTFDYEVISKQKEIVRLKNKGFYYKLSLVIAFFIILFLVLTQVNIEIKF